MVTKIFWTVVALDGIAAAVLWKLFARGTPGVVAVAYLALLAIIAMTALAFPLLRPERLRFATFILLLIMSAPLLYSSVAAAVNTVRAQRQFSGSAYFQGPALELAQAMVKHDADLVRQLIPAAGDLNQPREGGMTLWQFAALQADNTDASIDILRALLAAGADPKRDTSSDTLEHAVSTGPRLTGFLLEAGANPNLPDREHRPLWWRTLGPGENDTATELLRMLLDHGADLRLRAPDGRGPVGQAISDRYWYDACLLIERGADWRHEKLRGGSVPELLEWEIIRRGEYPIPVPAKLRTVLAGLKGEPVEMPAERSPVAGDIRIPDLLRQTSFENLEESRAALLRLAQQPNWVQRVAAFFEEGDSTQRNHVALLLSLKPDALPEDVQEQCWTVLREQMDWYMHSTVSAPREPKGWLLKETAVIAAGLASIPGPIRERHRADFTAVRNSVEECRKSNDPAASQLADLKTADWTALQAI